MLLLHSCSINVVTTFMRMSMYVSNIHECYIIVNGSMFGHININDMLSGSGTDAHIHERSFMSESGLNFIRPKGIEPL